MKIDTYYQRQEVSSKSVVLCVYLLPFLRSSYDDLLLLIVPIHNINIFYISISPLTLCFILIHRVSCVYQLQRNDDDDDDDDSRSFEMIGHVSVSISIPF